MVGGSRAPQLSHRFRASRLSPPKLLVAIRDTHPKVRMGQREIANATIYLAGREKIPDTALAEGFCHGRMMSWPNEEEK
jgi:hypothetical protein